jgi:hypothetical protein
MPLLGRMPAMEEYPNIPTIPSGGSIGSNLPEFCAAQPDAGAGCLRQQRVALEAIGERRR